MPIKFKPNGSYALALGFMEGFGEGGIEPDVRERASCISTFLSHKYFVSWICSAKLAHHLGWAFDEWFQQPIHLGSNKEASVPLKTILPSLNSNVQILGTRITLTV